MTLSTSISEPSHPGTYAGHVSSPLLAPPSQIASGHGPLAVPAIVDPIVQSGGMRGVEEEGWCPSTHSDIGLQCGARRDVFSGTSQSYRGREVETGDVPGARVRRTKPNLNILWYTWQVG